MAIPEHNHQLDRYKKLIAYIDDHLNQDISIEKVEEICHYSYRNINRIFEALHQETIGKHIKRLRLEKAAQYLRYSDIGIAQIAYQVGFEDRSAFSKAFKKKYDCSPQAFRQHSEIKLKEIQTRLIPEEQSDRERLKYEIEYLPDFEYLFLEYRGQHQDTESLSRHWKKLFQYASDNQLVSEQSIFMTAIIDDEEISDHINTRYHISLLLEKPLDFDLKELFRTKSHKRRKYARFRYKKSTVSIAEYYQQIFAFWMMDINLELADLPILEFYPEFDGKYPEITDIYIPVQ